MLTTSEERRLLLGAEGGVHPALTLIAPLPNRTSLSALCEGLAPATLATVGEQELAR